MLASLIATFASGETANAVRRVRRAALAYAFAALAALCGVGFLAGAAFIALAHRYGPINTAIGFGVFFLLLAGLVLAVHAISNKARARRIARRRNSDVAAIAGAAAISLLPSLLRGKGGLGGVVAPLIAVAAYAIYRENTKRGAPPTDDENA